MGERRVQLRFGRYVHPLYREQLHAAPAGFSYAYDHPALTDATVPTKRVVERGGRFSEARELAERLALRTLGSAGYVHMVRGRPLPGVSLIHACERLLARSPLPYVLDFEHAELFALYQRRALERPWARAVLERALLDDRLRFLLPWSEAAGHSLLVLLSPDAVPRVEAKLRVVSPAIRPAVTELPDGGGGSLRVLFVGTLFFEKGGVEAVRALQRARATHDITLDVVSYVPPEWRRRLEGEPGLVLHEPGGADFIGRLYRQADVLLFPSHMDTFGYVVLEAMAHGLPVLAPRHLALEESVQDGVSGLLFEPEHMMYGADGRSTVPRTLPPPPAYLESLRAPSDAYVDSIAATMCRLAEDRGLHSRLAEGALEAVRSGHLSIPVRQEKLRAVYEAAHA